MAEIPKIAAIVAAYNAEQTIVAAVESILANTVECRVYVVDDHSRTPVADRLKHLLDRIVLIRLDANVGPGAARNVAIQKVIDAGFAYVAIVDADDISEPDRLQKQLAFMETHPRVGACGTWAQEFYLDIKDAHRNDRRPIEPDKVRDLMFFNMAISHATAMIRTEAFKHVGLYSSVYPVAEDYDLFRRIGMHYDLANIPECLLYYRLSPSGQSQSRRKRQLFDRFCIQLKYFDALKWQAWAGVMRTFVTFFVPRRVFMAVKSMLHG